VKEITTNLSDMSDNSAILESLIERLKDSNYDREALQTLLYSKLNHLNSNLANASISIVSQIEIFSNERIEVSQFLKLIKCNKI